MTEDNSLRFPEGFLWGNAVCSHQSDGHNVHSDWWEFEQKGKIRDGTVSGAACDMWNRYEEDFDFMQRMGYTAFRMSAEWARIEPRRREWDDAALERTAAMVRALKTRGIAACLTLYHWTLPKWVADAGGWTNRDAAGWFGRYCRRVVEALGDDVDVWVTLNEPMCPVIAGYVAGVFPPEKRNPILAAKVFRNLLRGHVEAHEAIRRGAEENGRPAPPIGIAQAVADYEPMNPKNPIESKIIEFVYFVHNFAFPDAMATGRVPFPFGVKQEIPGLAGTFNYVGANYYTRYRIKPKIKWPMNYTDLLYIPPGADKSEMGWESYPPGFYKLLMDLKKRYNEPIYITENGCGDATDVVRRRYLLTHLAQLRRAIRAGVDVRGYFHWTFIDNFEWAEGWRPKLGLLAMDPVTRDRIPRPSATMFSEIARANGVTPEIVERYAPGVMEEVFG